MNPIDLQSIIVALTGHASAGGLVGGIAATALGAIATNALTAGLNAGGVKAALNPLNLNVPALGITAAPAAAAPVAAPVAAPAATTHTITLANATALGWIVNGVANLPAGVTISG